MNFGWFGVMLLMPATVVLLLVGFGAWEEFKAWRLNRAYSPGHRRGKRPDNRRRD